MSGIPNEYVGTTLEALPDDREAIAAFRTSALASGRRSANGVFLHSLTTGNGKTERACALAQSYLIARAKEIVNQALPSTQLVQFVNVAELMALIKRGFDDDRAAAQAQETIDRLSRAEIVILDDIGVEKSTEFVMERLYTIINSFWANRAKQTLLVTSNKTLDQIELTLGARIRSRIEGLCLPIEFKGADKRRRVR
jgi:DNA replication protein DnaC